MKRTFPHYTELDAIDFGPSCLSMIAQFYGHNFALQTLREKSFKTRMGVSISGICHVAKNIGFRTQEVHISFEQLMENTPLPCIIHWDHNHFVVCYDIKRKQRFLRKEDDSDDFTISISDPASGLLTYTKEEFLRRWISNKPQDKDKGVALKLYTTPAFYDQEDDKTHTKANLQHFFHNLRPHKKHLFNRQ
jgi:ATP-binding cassette subfamily B protein